MRSTGREQEAVEAALLVVGDEQAAGAEHRGEEQRHPQHAGGEVAVDLAALQREVEDDERGDAEERHRRHRLRRAQLQAQLLAQHGADGPPHRYSAPIRAGVDLARRRHQVGAPGAQPEREVGLGEPAGRVVARDDPRAPARGADERLDELGRRRVEVGARLVEQQHLGVVQHGAADGQALDHAARVGVDLVVGARREPDALEQLPRALERHAVQARVEGEVLAPAEVAVEQRRVAEQPDAPAHGPALVGQRVAEHARGAGVRAQQRREHAQQRRLARPVGAEDHERRARRAAVSVTSCSATRSP